MNYRILLVEDDEALGYLLQEYLKTEGFRTEWAKNGTLALSILKKSKFDLCLLDIMMPKMDGFELMQQLRSRNDFIPIIFLTAKSLKEDKLKAFHIGADDYLVKPVDEDELIARIKAVLKRSKVPVASHATYQIGQMTFDVANQKLTFDAEQSLLTELETNLLLMLCECKGEILPRTQVLQKLWGKDDYFTRRSMDVFISRLRKHLAMDENVKIKNVHGSGFVLEEK